MTHQKWRHSNQVCLFKGNFRLELLNTCLLKTLIFKQFFKKHWLIIHTYILNIMINMFKEVLCITKSSLTNSSKNIESSSKNWLIGGLRQDGVSSSWISPTSCSNSLIWFNEMMRIQIQNLSQHVVWTLVVCPIGSLDSTDGTLELDLELGLKQVDWDNLLSHQNAYLCEHLSRLSLICSDCFEAYTVAWFLNSSLMCSVIPHAYYHIPKMEVMV